MREEGDQILVKPVKIQRRRVKGRAYYEITLPREFAEACGKDKVYVVGDHVVVVAPDKETAIKAFGAIFGGKLGGEEEGR